MKPDTREELRRLVTGVTLETYEELAPQLVMMLDQLKKREDLSQDQMNDEILLNMMGYIKSCTNEIMIQVLGEILELPAEERHDHDHDHMHDET
ncbi:hypothetical protein [Qiania dongpingensis]|uniref:Uncharacterized protein n=1 Tax=Qiania dongpingensis TaxID=2763669 RepID=A0A7G9G5K8_9FIRM|nr:hypothetical protein [Qiania dongpingensis]QNM06090.1 hypothetical protein H9Q78_02700 [Qiania dongpingensis]